MGGDVRADIFEFMLFLFVVLILAYPLGKYMAKVFKGEKTPADFFFLPLERCIYKITGVDPHREMGWKEYGLCLLLFNFLGAVFLYALLRLQHLLPLNPQGLGPLTPDLAFNTAVSFMTNTDWQAYSGEKAISYFSRITGLTVQNFLSAATGIAGAMALIRGLVRQEADTLGNFWVDLTRSVLWLFSPLIFNGRAPVGAAGGHSELQPLSYGENPGRGAQTIAMGPAASHDIITFLGTNGGGVFVANSAHPFQNPTPLSNFLEMVSIIIVPAALVFTFGEMVGNRRQAWPLLAAMLLLFMLALAMGYGAEYYGNPLVKALGVEAPTAMEGKELRLGIANSTLFSTVMTAATCGTVNNMHDSRTPLSGLILIFQMMLQVVFGGVRAGLYGMIVFALLTYS